MTKRELIQFLAKKREKLSDEEKSYLDEELKALKMQSDDLSKICSIFNNKKTIEKNYENILTFYLLSIAPYPDKLQHHWQLADMADVDCDFSPSGRDSIKAWLKEKFGEDNCVSIGTYGTLGVKGSVQEISRVYGISPFAYLKISKLVSDDDKDLSEEEIREKYPEVDNFLKKHPEVARSLTKLTGMKKNVGQHAGGFVVSSDDLTDIIPIIRANKGYVTGWQESGAIKELEALGVIKVDILGLACVEQIRLCVEEINHKYPKNNLPKDIYLLPQDDPKVYKFINTLQLDNIFQMESKVFVEAVRRIKPQSLQDISNISTLIRPGAAEVDDYVTAPLERREPKCLHSVYNHTRGLMIYQEQLMQVPMELADFSIFEADRLRRLVRKIGKAKTSDTNRQAMLKECEKYQSMYMDAAVPKIMREDGWDIKEATKYADDQWKQIMLQAKYAFNMPHSYAYSLMGYVQAYLKCYYPLEFWTASLNTIDRGQEKHGQSSLGKYINSINKAGIKVHRPNINKSGILFESDKDGIYFALSYIKDTGKGAESIIKYRPYKNWEDFLKKAVKNKINKSVVKGCIFSGAADFDDTIEERPYKWLLYLAEKGKKVLKSGGTSWDKKIKKELDEFQKNMPEIYQLIQIEYEYCKYSFHGFKDILEGTKYCGLKTISDRDQDKKLWVLAAYIDDVKIKKSKKSGNEYVLITITDFREAISVFAFGEQNRKDIIGKFTKGQLVKIAIKNDSNWLKLCWPSEVGNKPAIQIIRA